MAITRFFLVTSSYIIQFSRNEAADFHHIVTGRQSKCFMLPCDELRDYIPVLLRRRSKQKSFEGILHKGDCSLKTKQTSGQLTDQLVRIPIAQRQYP